MVDIDGIRYDIITKGKYASVIKYTTQISSNKTVIIPSTVTHEGVECTVKYIKEEAFSRSNRTSIKLPNTIESIGNRAFYSCSDLTEINIPNSVKSIGNEAFYGCSSLKSVTIPNSVATIGKSAFSYCSNLKTVEIPNSVSKIDDFTFQYCNNLKTIIIPSSVKEISRSAFNDCEKLESVYCYANTPPTTLYGVAGWFEGSYWSYISLYVPAESIDKYLEHNLWGLFGNILPMSSGEYGIQCEKPTISYSQGELTFTCETNNAKIQYNYSIALKNYGTAGSNSIKPQIKLTVNAWATAEGMTTSDIATVTFDVNAQSASNNGDVNKDGNVDISDIVSVINIIAKGI